MTSTAERPSTKFIWLLLGWIVISFGLRLYFLDNVGWTYDEGIHVLLAQLLARGYEPYREVFISYPPLYTLSIDWGWRVFGSVEGLQILMALYTMPGLLAVGLIGWRLGGAWAGLAAAVFVSLEPEFFRGSRAVLTEVPSLSIAALSIAFAAFYYWQPPQQTGRVWLIASGVALAASLMLKILSPYVLGLTPLMILVRQWQFQKPLGRAFWKRTLVDGLIWSAALLIPIIVFTLPFDLPAYFDQVIRFRFATRGAYEGEDNNFLVILTFLAGNWVISLPALAGIAWLIRHRWRAGWFVLLWLGLAVAFALIQVPLREKHLPLLLLPLSVLAGLGLTGVVQLIGHRRGRPIAYAAIISLILLGLVYFWQVGRVFTTYAAGRLEFLDREEQVAVDFIRKFTAPDDCLITDDPTLAFVANRPVPPMLAEASSARLRSGYLTADMLVNITAQSDCQIVAPVAVRFKRSAPEFVEWAKGQYLALWLYDGATELLMAKPVGHSQPQQPVGAQLADLVQLEGYDLTPVMDGVAYLSLYWRPLRPFEQDFTIFVHLRDGAGNTVLNADHQPYDGRAPTSRWPAGSLIKETIRLEVPPELLPGAYNMYVGMYLRDGSNFVRLPIVADNSGENAVIIPIFITQ
jgi:uncharacterized membrane protein YczE